jgi:putative spermidine/putrescine transport system permease protein
LLPVRFPALMLTAFFIVPFGIMIAVSFFKRVQGAFYTPDFVWENYARFLSAFFGGVLSFSLFSRRARRGHLPGGRACPFTYRLTRLPRRLQVVWLVALLAILSLSEVIIGFAWSTLLSRTAGSRTSSSRWG